MTHFFAQLDTGEVKYLGEHKTFGDADEMAPGCTLWIHNEVGLRELVDNAKDALQKARPENPVGLT